jgi:hypothetical protein
MSAQRSFVGFDQQHQYGGERRADVVFGPDMFDPRVMYGGTPLSDAVARGDSDIDPIDFDKAVGEVLGEDVTLDELTRVCIANVKSIKVTEPEIIIPRTESVWKKFVARLLN